jgi:NTP pyrophosphatase (non-canonical NTP hydrolase)
MVHWRGIGKLAEECGEVVQIIGKAVAFPLGDHPDGRGPVHDRLIEELGDLQAAIDYVCQTNGLPDDQIQARRERKLQLFHQWGLPGIQPPTESA